jgi:branched-subunit amino acid ABC-type transport system permease component
MLIISLILFAIIALIVAAVFGLLSSIVAWRIVRRKNWSHKRLIVLLAAITPALFIGMEAVLGLIGSVYISETKGVDWGFGDYWEAPLSASHSLSAVDMPETASIRENGPYQEGSGRVEHLWVQDDSVFVAIQDKAIPTEMTDSSSITYSLYLFLRQNSGVDTLLNRVDTLQLAKTLRNRNLDVKTALTPDDYFTYAQREAHKIESPVRHTIVIVTILALWVALIRFIKKKSVRLNTVNHHP